MSGSGAGALATAVTARDGGCEVESLEVADLIGGTSAASGGMPWIPLDEHMLAAGIDDWREGPSGA